MISVRVPQMGYYADSSTKIDILVMACIKDKHWIVLWIHRLLIFGRLATTRLSLYEQEIEMVNTHILLCSIILKSTLIRKISSRFRYKTWVWCDDSKSSWQSTTLLFLACVICVWKRVRNWQPSLSLSYTSFCQYMLLLMIGSLKM